jgi:hypothetical protein
VGRRQHAPPMRCAWVARCGAEHSWLGAMPLAAVPRDVAQAVRAARLPEPENEPCSSDPLRACYELSPHARKFITGFSWARGEGLFLELGGVSGGLYHQ